MANWEADRRNQSAGSGITSEWTENADQDIGADFLIHEDRTWADGFCGSHDKPKQGNG